MGRATRRPQTTRDPLTAKDVSSSDPSSPGSSTITSTITGELNSSSVLLSLVTRGCTPLSDLEGGTNPGKQQYLETSTILGCVNYPEYKLREIVDRPEGVDYNEWLASHTISFFDHVNMLYGCISEFCTMSGCPEMAGPGNRQYVWIDEKGKRSKLPAPQYVDYALTSTQKTVNDESIFPTKFDKEFPPSFESHVKRMVRLMFNILAHMYHGHFREIVALNLHPHLNCLFSHLVLFNDTFKLMDNEKELETLVDDIYTINLSHFSPLLTTVPGTAVTTTDSSTSIVSTSSKSTMVAAVASSSSRSSPSRDSNIGNPPNSKSAKQSNSPNHSPLRTPTTTCCGTESSTVVPMEIGTLTPLPPSSPSVTPTSLSHGTVIQQQPCPNVTTILPVAQRGQESTPSSRMETD